jgi:hypothetical protein
MLSRTLARASMRCMVLAALSVTGLAPAHAGAAPPEPVADSYRSAGTIASWYELRLAEGVPRGIVLVLHGGAWRNVGATPLRQVADYRAGELVREWRARGFITVLSTYGYGEAGWTDVVAVYDQLHARYPDLPIGAYGQSAGGQLALLLGAARDLAFVVSDAGPTDWDTWRSTYPCFYRDCALVAGTAFTGVGAYWVDVMVAETFGAQSDPAPNLTDYDPLPNYDATHGPDPFLIYGRRYRQSDPDRTQIADGTPRDGVDANAYVDGDDDPATTADQLETDTLVTQQQGALLAERVGARAVLRTLPRGTVPWVHAYVDGPIASSVYAEMYDWTAAKAAAARAPPPTRANLGVPPLDDVPSGAYVVRTCDTAPRGSGIFATGAWQPRLSAGVGMDAAEAGCSTASSAQEPGEGMELRTRPSAASTVAAGGSAAMTFTAPPGTTIAEYAASYRGERTSRGWSTSLVATDASGSQTTLVACDAGVACEVAPDALVPPGTADAATGPFPTQRFTLAPGTASLSWQLVCEQPGGCPNQDVSFLDVYGSSITISDLDPPAQATVMGDFGDGLGHDGTLVGAIGAFDSGSGVRRVDVTFAGVTQTSSPPCDFSMPRPCPARDSFAIQADVSALDDGPHPLAVTVTDASGRRTTSSSEVVVGLAQMPAFAGDEPVAPGQPAAIVGSTSPAPAAFDPFATGSGREQLAACTGAPFVLASRLRGRRLVVQAIASRRLAGRLAVLRSVRRRVASAKVGTDGSVRLSGRLRSTELGGYFSVSVGASRLQQLTACGRWRRVGLARATVRGRFAASVAAGPGPGGAYRAMVVTVPRRGAAPRRSSSVVAVT